MLLNLVKLRYADAPVFLEVSSIISGYTLETTLSAQLKFDARNNQSVNGTGKYTDRPTITYSPLVGEKFTRELLTPIAPASILSLVQSGWPIDRVFSVCVQSINGIDNRSGTMALSCQADPQFYEVLAAMKRIQKSGTVGIRVEKRQEEVETILFFEEDTDEPIRQDKSTVRQLLGLDPNSNEFRLVQARVAGSPNELAMLTRSVMEILLEIATNVDVPAADLEGGRVHPLGVEDASASSGMPHLMRIHSGKAKSPDAFIAIRYRKHWFWIDDRDPYSKGTLTFLMILASLAETGPTSGGPVVTIPAG
jgi:hypothetical protein